jgi:hypothetical protein
MDYQVGMFPMYTMSPLEWGTASFAQMVELSERTHPDDAACEGFFARLKTELFLSSGLAGYNH